MRRLFALAFSALAITLSLAGCSSDDPATLLARARQHQERGDHASAIIELRNLLGVDPRNIEARHQLALSYIANNQPGAAEDEVRKALDEGADPRRFRSTLARALLFQGKNERLLDEIVPTPDADPGDAIAISAARGLAYIAIGRFADAKVLLERVIATDPKHPEALLGLAGITLAEDNVDGAFKFVERATENTPKNIDAWMLKGEMLRITKKLPEAIEAYQHVLRLDAANIPAHMQLTSLLIDSQKFEEAGKHLEVVRSKVQDNALANYLFALIEFRKNNLTVAKKAVNEALQITPNHTPSLLLAGAIEYASGSFEAASAKLRNVLDRAPGSIIARRMLAISLIQEGQVQRAIELLEQSLALAPDDIQMLALLGEAHLQNSDLERAIPYLERASKADPASDRAKGSLQIARLLGGQSARTLAELEGTMKLESVSSGRLELLYLAALIQRRQFDAAVKFLPRLEKNQPNNPATHNLKAAVLIASGNPDAARRSLETAVALNSRFMPAVVNLVKLDLRERNPRQARRRLELLLERDPSNPTALTTLSELAPSLGITNELLLEILERARRANPNGVKALVLLSGAQLRSGNAQKALELAESAQRLTPDNSDVLDALGSAQMGMGRPGDALGAFSKLAAQNPNAPSVLFRLGRAQAANGNSAGATFTLRKALSIDPKFAPAMALLGEIEVSSGRWQTANQLIAELKSGFPNSPVGHLLEGDALTAQKQHATALKAYQTAMKLGERSGRTAIKISRTLSAVNRGGEADAFLNEYLRENPKEPTVIAYIADSHLTAGRFERAAEYYLQALEGNASNPLILNNLAWASFKLNDNRAKQYAEKAYSLAPENPIVLDTYGWILSKMGDMGRALEILQRAVTNAPDSRQIRFHFAQALIKSGQYGRGRKEVEVVLAGSGPFDEEAAARELLKNVR